MKIRLVKTHRYKAEYVRELEESILDKEMTAEKILHVLVSEFTPLVPVRIEDGILYVDHPAAW